VCFLLPILLPFPTDTLVLVGCHSQALDVQMESFSGGAGHLNQQRLVAGRRHLWRRFECSARASFQRRKINPHSKKANELRKQEAVHLMLSMHEDGGLCLMPVAPNAFNEHWPAFNFAIRGPEPPMHQQAYGIDSRIWTRTPIYARRGDIRSLDDLRIERAMAYCKHRRGQAHLHKDVKPCCDQCRPKQGGFNVTEFMTFFDEQGNAVSSPWDSYTLECFTDAPEQAAPRPTISRQVRKKRRQDVSDEESDEEPEYEGEEDDDSEVTEADSPKPSKRQRNQQRNHRGAVRGTAASTSTRPVITGTRRVTGPAMASAPQVIAAAAAACAASVQPSVQRTLVSPILHASSVNYDSPPPLLLSPQRGQGLTDGEQSEADSQIFDAQAEETPSNYAAPRMLSPVMMIHDPEEVYLEEYPKLAAPAPMSLPMRMPLPMPPMQRMQPRQLFVAPVFSSSFSDSPDSTDSGYWTSTDSSSSRFDVAPQLPDQRTTLGVGYGCSGTGFQRLESPDGQLHSRVPQSSWNCGWVPDHSESFWDPEGSPIANHMLLPSYQVPEVQDGTLSFLA
jgi:hypothetical protein